MNLLRGFTEVIFEEPALEPHLPACLPLVAACAAAGWRLANDGSPNHEDCETGLPELGLFKDAPKSKKRRFVAWRFRQKEIFLFAGLFRVEQFAAELCRDRALYKAARLLPKFEKFRLQLIKQLNRNCRSISPVETSGDTTRRLLVPAWAAEPLYVANLNGSFLNGW